MPPDIAVIDSGINASHCHVRKVSGGHGYGFDAAGRVEKRELFADEIGHGTAIAGILRKKAPFATLYGIKIFQKELTAPAAVLTAALTWAIGKAFKIIHLSLGSDVAAYREMLITLCQKAHEQGLVIVAAARGPKDQVLPAALDTVIGVFWDRECSEDQISYFPGQRVQFGAYGWPRALPGMPQEMNFRGNSFAVAHVTGAIAGILHQHPRAGVAFLKEQLCQMATEKR